MTSTMKFYYTSILMSLFEGHKSVNSIKTFWNFTQGEMLNHMYWEFDYGDLDQGNKYVCPLGGKSIGPCPVSKVDRNILYENKLLGLPRYIICLNCIVSSVTKFGYFLDWDSWGLQMSLAMCLT